MDVRFQPIIGDPKRSLVVTVKATKNRDIFGKCSINSTKGFDSL